jgi:hypothetical protein
VCGSSLWLGGNGSGSGGGGGGCGRRAGRQAKFARKRAAKSHNARITRFPQHTAPYRTTPHDPRKLHTLTHALTRSSLTHSPQSPSHSHSHSTLTHTTHRTATHATLHDTPHHTRTHAHSLNHAHIHTMPLSPLVTDDTHPHKCTHAIPPRQPAACTHAPAQRAGLRASTWGRSSFPRRSSRRARRT